MKFQNTIIFNQGYELENAVCKLSTILSWLWGVNAQDTFVYININALQFLQTIDIQKWINTPRWLPLKLDITHKWYSFEIFLYVTFLTLYEAYNVTNVHERSIHSTKTSSFGKILIFLETEITSQVTDDTKWTLHMLSMYDIIIFQWNLSDSTMLL